jgi:pilus assembly protein CpaE
MPIYLWSADIGGTKVDAIEHRLRAVLPDLATIPAIDDVLARPATDATGPNFVIAVTPSKDRHAFSRLLETADRHRDRLFLILVSDEISVGDYKMVTRSGAADWVSADADPQEILDIIARRQARTAEARLAQRSESRSVAISFVPSAGGVGNTTLLVETGVYLKTNKATRNRKICLVDLDFQSSNICDYLDIEPRLQIQEISTDPERLDSQLFDIFVSRHASGLDVIAAPRAKFEYCDLDVSALDTLFSIAASRYDLILIDLPITWFAWTPNVIAASDAALVVGVNTVPGLRQTGEALAAIREVPHAPSRIAVAVNRCQRRLIGGIARRHHVETVLGNEQIVYIGEEPMAVEAVNTGSPMALNKSHRAIGKDIAALAEFCASVASTHAGQS